MNACCLVCRLAANSRSCFVIANLDRFFFLFDSFSICLPTRGPISLRFLFNQSYHPPTVGSFFISWLHYVHSHTQQQTCISFVLEQIFFDHRYCLNGYRTSSTKEQTRKTPCDAVSVGFQQKDPPVINKCTERFRCGRL